MKLKAKLSLTLISAILLSSFALCARAAGSAGKDEIIYAKLDNSGSVSGVFAVNAFEVDKDTVIEDFGDYLNVLNMTNSDDIIFTGGKTEIKAEKGMFYYQGNMQNVQLPWNIALSYYLDGSEINPAELGGKSGGLEVFIAVTENKNAVSGFFDAFTLQISVSLDAELCGGIKAPGAAIVSAGGTKQLNYNILPGTGGNYSFSAVVSDFKMEPITFAAVRTEIAFDLGELDLTLFTDEISGLKEGIAQFDDGVNEIADNMSTFQEGLDAASNGLGSLDEGLSLVLDGAKQLSGGAAELELGLNVLSVKGIELKDGAKAMLDATFEAANAALAAEFRAQGLDSAPVLEQNSYKNTINFLLTAYPEASKQLEPLTAQLDGAVAFYEGIAEYTGGVSGLYEGSRQLSGGIIGLAEGLSSLRGGVQAANAGVAELCSGMRALSAGMTELSGGSGKLRAGTADMDTKISEAADEAVSGIMEKYSGEYRAKSFISDQNTDIKAVQFVFKTEGINPPPKQVTPEPEPKQLNVWQKFLRLFGIGKQ